MENGGRRRCEDGNGRSASFWASGTRRGRGVAEWAREILILGVCRMGGDQEPLACRCAPRACRPRRQDAHNPEVT